MNGVSGLASWCINFTHPKEWQWLSIHSHPKLHSVPGREAPTSPRHRRLWRCLEVGDVWVYFITISMVTSIPITTQNLLLSNLLATLVSPKQMAFLFLSGQLSSLCLTRGLPLPWNGFPS